MSGTDTSWVNLLSSRERAGKLIRVSDNTPNRGHGRRSRISEVNVLRCQVAALLKDKRRLTEDALKVAIELGSLWLTEHGLSNRFPRNVCRAEKTKHLLSRKWRR